MTVAWSPIAGAPDSNGKNLTVAQLSVWSLSSSLGSPISVETLSVKASHRVDYMRQNRCFAPCTMQVPNGAPIFGCLNVQGAPASEIH